MSDEIRERIERASAQVTSLRVASESAVRNKTLVELLPINVEGIAAALSQLAADCEGLIRERDEARDWVRRLVRDTQTLTCVYCGHAYPPGTPTHGSDILTAHIEVCEKHPARAMREERNRLLALLKGACDVGEEAAQELLKAEQERDRERQRAEEAERRLREAMEWRPIAQADAENRGLKQELTHWQEASGNPTPEALTTALDAALDATAQRDREWFELRQERDTLAEGVRLYRMESPPFAQPMQIKEWERAHGHLVDRDAKLENITEGGEAPARRNCPRESQRESGVEVKSPPVGAAGGDACVTGACVFCGGEELSTDTHARACCDRKRAGRGDESAGPRRTG